MASWYIYRYKNLTTRMKDYFRATSTEVFLPYRHIRKKDPRTGQVEYIDKPVISGYIFIHSELETAISIGQELGLPLWQRHLTAEEQHQAPLTPTVSLSAKTYFTVSESDMQYFQQAVDLRQQDIDFFDASLIDVHKDDQVVFLSGEMKGVRGYLKTEQGRDGGLFIVPLTESVDCAVTSPSTLCYTLHARPEQIGVISFAKGNRHARNHMRSCEKLCDEAMQSFVEGKDLPASQRERLLSYLFRYDQLKLDSEIQRAAHHMLLYRIYTLLEIESKRTEAAAYIAQSIIPAFERRVGEALRRGSQEAQRQFADYLQLKEATLHAPDKRREAFRKLK